MSRLCLFCLIILCLGVLAPKPVFADPEQRSAWMLPLALSDKNTRVSYQYSTTMGGSGEGKSSNVSGKVWLGSDDFKSVKAKLVVPVPSNIFSGDAFGPLGNMVSAAQLPPVTISIDHIPNLCDPALISSAKPCIVRLEGSAAIGTFTKPVVLLGRIERKAQSFEISGNSFLDTGAASSQVPGLQLIDEASLRFTIQIPAA